MRYLTIVLLIAAAIVLESCGCTRVNPNEWVVRTTDCWQTYRTLKAGDTKKLVMGVCNKQIVLPAAELSGEFVVNTKFENRLAGEISMTYQWKITKPEDFIKSAKTLVSGNSDNDKISASKLEAVENAVVDKYLMNLIRETTPEINGLEVDELALELLISDKAEDTLDGRGVEFFNISLNVDVSDQAEEALDVLSALKTYKAAGEEEFGREIIKAKAGAPIIHVNTCPENTIEE